MRDPREIRNEQKQENDGEMEETVVRTFEQMLLRTSIMAAVKEHVNEISGDMPIEGRKLESTIVRYMPIMEGIIDQFVIHGFGDIPPTEAWFERMIEKHRESMSEEEADVVKSELRNAMSDNNGLDSLGDGASATMVNGVYPMLQAFAKSALVLFLATMKALMEEMPDIEKALGEAYKNGLPKNE